MSARDIAAELNQYTNINIARAKLGLSQLSYSECLSGQALNWSVYMSTHGVQHPVGGISPQIIACKPNFTNGGQNVGQGLSSQQVFDYFMNSQTHRNVTISPLYKTVGIGCYRKDDSSLWVTHNYEGLIGGDGVLPTYSFTPAWGPWAAQGGYTNFGVSVCSFGDEHSNVYVRGSDGQIWHKYYLNGIWSPWYVVPGSGGLGIIGEPTVIASSQGRIDLFVTSSNGMVYHTYYSNGWVPWRSIGASNLSSIGAIVSSPAVTVWGSRMDVFVRSSKNALYHKWWTGSAWTNWENLGGALYDAPAACAWGLGRIDIFAKGSKSNLIHKVYDGRWHEWEDLGGGILGRPGVSSRGPGKLDIFVTGVDNKLYRRWYDSASGWHWFENLAGGVKPGPSSVSWGPNHIDVFAPGLDGQTWHRIWR